jgi:hypothetical protein
MLPSPAPPHVAHAPGPAAEVENAVESVCRYRGRTRDTKRRRSAEKTILWIEMIYTAGGAVPIRDTLTMLSMSKLRSTTAAYSEPGTRC